MDGKVGGVGLGNEVIQRRPGGPTVVGEPISAGVVEIGSTSPVEALG